MQKFKKKLRNTPKDTSQVLCSVNSQLKKEETLSVESGLKNDKLFLNNPDGNLSESNRRQNMSVSVYVLNQRGKPLMPCSPRKALVFVNGKWKETSGTHNKGTRVLVEGKSLSIKLITKYFNQSNLIWRYGVSSPA